MNVKCEEIEPLCEAFALNALDPEETALVESHIQDCPNCQQRVDAYQETLALLPYAAQAADPLRAPESLKAKVLQAVAAEVQAEASETQIESEPEPHLQTQRPQGSSRWQRWVQRLRLPNSPWVPALAATQVVLLVALGWLIFNQRATENQLTDQATQLEQGLQILLSGDIDSRFMQATAEAPAGSWGRFYTKSDSDMAVVLVADTPLPSSDSDYHFWFKLGEEFTDAGVVIVDVTGGSTGRGWLITHTPQDYEQVLVTLESKDSSSDQPLGPTLMAANYRPSA